MRHLTLASVLVAFMIPSPVSALTAKFSGFIAGFDGTDPNPFGLMLGDPVTAILTYDVGNSPDTSVDFSLMTGGLTWGFAGGTAVSTFEPSIAEVIFIARPGPATPTGPSVSGLTLDDVSIQAGSSTNLTDGILPGLADLVALVAAGDVTSDVVYRDPSGSSTNGVTFLFIPETVQAVPAPASLLLMLSGLAAVFACRRVAG